MKTSHNQAEKERFERLRNVRLALPGERMPDDWKPSSSSQDFCELSFGRKGRYAMHLLAAGFSLIAVLLFGDAFAQATNEYPVKPVRVIVATAAGGATDIQARMFARKLSEGLGRQFFVENRPGGNYVPGYGSAARAAPDGYTLLSAAAVFTVVPSLNPDLPDPVKDYEAISLLTKAPYLLLVHPSVPAKSARDIIALAKAKPGVLDMGAGSGTSLTNLAARLFASSANVKITIIPYKGTGQTIIDVISGHIHMFFGNILSTLPHVKSGRLRAVAVSSADRSAVLPGLPTIAESGLPGYNVTTWHGWLAPASTPSAIIAKLSAELARAVRAPEVASRLVQDGGEPIGSTPEQFRRLISDEVPRWRKVIKDMGLRQQ